MFVQKTSVLQAASRISMGVMFESAKMPQRCTKGGGGGRDVMAFNLGELPPWWGVEFDVGGHVVEVRGHVGQKQNGLDRSDSSESPRWVVGACGHGMAWMDGRLAMLANHFLSVTHIVYSLMGI
eukprot:Gb_07354 [translate_table: standard]